MKKEFLLKVRGTPFLQNSDIQHKVLFMEVQKPFLFHFSKLERQSAALNGEKVRELLAGERDVKLDRAAPLRLGGEIGLSLIHI